MNTKEIISMVTERKSTLEKNMTNLSKDFFNSFKENLSLKLQDNPWISQAKKIGLIIEEFCETDFKVTNFEFLFDDKRYENEGFIPIDDCDILLFNSFYKEELETFLNLLKDYGFKLFVNENGHLVPFIEIK